MGISLITMSQGNVKALARTIASVAGVCDEIVFGDVIIFEQDRKEAMEKKYPVQVKWVPLDFNFICIYGFSATLNMLSHAAKNNLCLYLNVGEVITEGKDKILEKVNEEYNCYFIDHATDPHKWFRMYDKRALAWSGLIHEEIVWNRRPFYEAIFRFADTDKDMDDPFKAKVMNDVKEIVYFHQQVTLVEKPSKLGSTSRGWLDYFVDQYDSLKERLAKKGKRYEAFLEGNLEKYLEDVKTNPEFEKERFESSTLIEYQGDKKFLL